MKNLDLKFIKKFFLISSVFMIPLLGLSQGIGFEHGKWEEILDKAQLSQKPIFVDVYTSWCGPCKLMSRDIFPLENVGTIYNSKFICYQIDAEKGEGVEIAKKYNVNSFPTYLFLKPDGTIFYRGLGSMESNDFISLANTALMDMDDHKPIAVWEKEYISKKNDPSFILDYMNKRSKIGLSNASLFDDYLKLIPEAERASDVVMDLYKKEGRNLIVTSLAYSNLQQNMAKFNKAYIGVFSSYLISGILNTVKEAAKTKNAELLSAAVSAYEKLPRNKVIRSRDEIYLEYYRRTGETDKYLKHVADFCNNQLMHIQIDSIESTDKSTSQLLEKLIKTGGFPMLDSSKIALLKATSVNLEKNRIGQSLNKFAWEFFQKSTDTNLLRDAINWSKRSLELFPSKAAFLDTYANLLYKLGNKEEAITKEEEALQAAIKENYKDSKTMERTLEKMRAQEKTW